jgi:hypothetical protein
MIVTEVIVLVAASACVKDSIAPTGPAVCDYVNDYVGVMSRSTVYLTLKHLARKRQVAAREVPPQLGVSGGRRQTAYYPTKAGKAQEHTKNLRELVGG